jgi:outer membrane protein assembly factor BamB
MLGPRLACLAVTVLLFALPARGEDWPEFRGPTAQGTYPGRLPTEWSSSRNVAWKQPIPGKGWSSPVVVAGRVYLTTAVPTAGGKDLALQALCLDAGTGQTVWQQEVFHEDGKMAPPVHGKNSHASPTPLVHDGRLYVHFGHMGTACLEADTGRVVWRNDQIKYKPVHGNGGSPLVVDNLLVFSCDGSDQRFVVALDRGDGKVVWKTERDVPAGKGFSFGTPLLITVNGRRQIISTGSNVVSALDPADGKEIWRVRYNGYSVIPRPAFGHGLVFLSSGFDAPVLLAIRPDGSGDVTDTHVAWSSRKNAPLTPSPLLVDDDLYVLSDRGVLSCLDARTGRVYWQERLAGNFSASPLAADGKVYAQSEEGVGYVVRAGHQFEQLARNDIGERSLASCAAADGALFLRTDKHLYRIESR